MNQENFPPLVQSVIDAVPEGILYCDVDLNIRLVNKYYASLLGNEPHELYGTNLKDKNPKTRAVKVMKNGKPELWDMCSFPQSGDTKSYIVNRIPVRDGSDNVVGMVSHVLFKNPSELKELADKVKALSNRVNFYKNSIKSILKTNYDVESIIGSSDGKASGP